MGAGITSMTCDFLPQSLLQVLKESHKTRTAFRKVGGFVYVMSVLVSMEGALADEPKAPWTAGRRFSSVRHSVDDAIPTSNSSSDVVFDVLSAVQLLTENRHNVLLLVKLMFSVLTIVMRLEPANARFFATEVSLWRTGPNSRIVVLCLLCFLFS